jgi:hypothetical protein
MGRRDVWDLELSRIARLITISHTYEHAVVGLVMTFRLRLLPSIAG